MKYIEHAREGLNNLYHCKLRSLLALLGVLVGTASVVAMVLGGELATNEALRQFKSLGTDLLAVAIQSANEQDVSSGKLESISLSQALALTEQHDNILQAAPYTQLFQPVMYEGELVPSVVLGVTHHFANILRIRMQAGRFISLFDQYEFYCVIGQGLYQSLKKISFHEPVGQALQIGKHIFVIVGVADDWPENSFIYTNINHAVMVPLLASTVMGNQVKIRNILLQLAPDADIDGVEKKSGGEY